MRIKIQELEQKLASGQTGTFVSADGSIKEGATAPNWPPCFGKYAFAHNDIAGDFGPDATVDPAVKENFGMVTLAYRILLGNIVILWVNLACMCGYASGGDANTDQFPAVGIAMAFCLFGMPGAFYTWYRIIYLAAQHKDGGSGTSSYYFLAMTSFLISILFWICAACGFPGTYQAGLWFALQQFANAGDDDEFASTYEIIGFMSLVCFGLEICLLVASLWLWRMLRNKYNGGGGAEGLQNDGQAGLQQAMGDPRVQKAVGDQLSQQNSRPNNL